MSNIRKPKKKSDNKIAEELAYERRGHNIVHTMSNEAYAEQGRLARAEARYCVHCSQNDNGFCRKYKKWAYSVRESCKKKKETQEKRNYNSKDKKKNLSKTFVFDPDKICYRRTVLGYVSIEYIKRMCKDTIIIWLDGNLSTNQPNVAEYRAVLEYNGKGKCLSGQKENYTVNQIKIEGLEDCIVRIKKPSKICVVSETPIGFEDAFIGKGRSYIFLSEILKMIYEKNCKLSEINSTKSAEIIKKYIINCATR